MKFQIVGSEELCDDIAIEIAEIQNSDLAFGAAHIFNNFPGLGLTDSELIFRRIEFFHHLDKALDGKGVVLSRDPEFLFERPALSVFIQNNLILLIQLPGMVDKLKPVVCKRDAFSGTVKNNNAEFLLQFLNGAGQ